MALFAEVSSFLMVMLTYVSLTCGQTVNLIPSLLVVERGSDAELICSVTGVSTPVFLWYDVRVDPAILISFNGQPPVSPDYNDYDFTVNGASSTMTISPTVIDNEGDYSCQEQSSTLSSSSSTVYVEVKSTLAEITITPALEDGTDLIAGDSYNVQCEAVGARPQELFQLYINNVEAQTDNKTETFQVNSGDPNLTDTTTVFTITPTSNNNGQDMFCRTTGHQLSSLNQDSDSINLNVRYPPPSSGIMTVDLTQGENLMITCNVDVNEANPVISSFYIYENGTLIASASSHQKPTPDMETTYLCVAGNYLGNTSAVGVYSPDSVPIPSPTAGQTTILGPVASPKPTVNGTDGNIATTETTRGQENTDPTPTSDPPGTNIGAIVGGVIGGLVAVGLIVLLVCLYKKGIICQKSKSGSGYGSTHGPKENKVATSTNGKEKSAPKPTPRKSMEVMHTTQNPGGDEYAMVSKPQQLGGGGPDYADAGPNGRGQNDSNLHYADIDLSDKAGHTERHVPKNDKDVVVYSSILV